MSKERAPRWTRRTTRAIKAGLWDIFQNAGPAAAGPGLRQVARKAAKRVPGARTRQRAS